MPCRKKSILARNCAFVLLRVVEPSLESSRFKIEMQYRRDEGPVKLWNGYREEIDEKSGAVQNETIQ